MRKVLPALAALALLAGCQDEQPKRGIELLPDMFHTPAFKSQSAQVSPDGRSQAPAMLAPPEGTVPRSGAGYAIAPGDVAAAKLLQNPLVPDVAVLRAGRRDFEVFCGVCHGKDGNAGHASMTPFFPGVPSLAGDAPSPLSDGEIYHIVSVGRGRMPNHRAQLPPERRWAVVTYLRALQQATIATAKGGKELEALLATTGGQEFAPSPAPVPEYAAPAAGAPESKP